MKKPIFLFLYGTQKSGTTWLCETLNQSNEIYKNKNIFKEWRFWKQYLRFSKFKILMNYWRDKYKNANKKIRLHNLMFPKKFLGSIKNNFDKDTNLKLLADFTPRLGYDLNFNEFKMMSNIISNLNFEIKALWLIRDPVDRAISELKMRIKNNKIKSGLFYDNRKRLVDVDDKIIKNMVILSKYEKTFENIEKFNIPYKIIFFEDLFSQKSINDICNFLGIRPVNYIKEKIYFDDTNLNIDENIKQRLKLELTDTYAFLNHLKYNKQLYQF